MGQRDDVLRKEPSCAPVFSSGLADELAAAASPSPRTSAAAYRPPELGIVIPTLNERQNIEPLIERLERVLAPVAFELIFVDDDSHDGTTELLRDLERRRPHVRTLRRVGRRGLASACIEGMLATSAPYLAVMDADLQHDESVLPRMLHLLESSGLDIVVGTRFAAGGAADGLTSRNRFRLSRLGARLSQLISGVDLSDPMSGYFVLRRSFFESTLRRLSGHGFKILLDLFASAPRRVRYAEVPYHFRDRHAGESKLDTLVMLDYLALLGDKLLGRHIPVRFVVFVMVGLFGLALHLAFLALLLEGIGLSFYTSQAMATLLVMAVNFNMNNMLTYRDIRLRGLGLLHGHLSFYLICSIGAIANFELAEMLYEHEVPWAAAGLLGALVSAAWNHGVSSTFTWRQRAATR